MAVDETSGEGSNTGIRRWLHGTVGQPRQLMMKKCRLGLKTAELSFGWIYLVGFHSPCQVEYLNRLGCPSSLCSPEDCTTVFELQNSETSQANAVLRIDRDGESQISLLGVIPRLLGMVTAHFAGKVLKLSSSTCLIRAFSASGQDSRPTQSSGQPRNLYNNPQQSDTSRLRSCCSLTVTTLVDPPVGRSPNTNPHGLEPPPSITVAWRGMKGCDLAAGMPVKSFSVKEMMDKGKHGDRICSRVRGS